MIPQIADLRGFVRGRNRPEAFRSRALPAVSPATAAASIFLGSGLIYGQRPSLEVTSIERVNRRLSLLLTTHFHKTKASRSTGKSVRDHSGGVNSAVCRKDLLQLVLRNSIG